MPPPLHPRADVAVRPIARPNFPLAPVAGVHTLPGMTLRWIPFLLCLLGLGAPLVRAVSFDTVIVDTVKTSIYVGSVTLKTTPFRRTGDRFAADYRARVFPYFFQNEKGHLTVEFTQEQLERLHRGERVTFTGHAENTDKEPRRIEGHATPSAAGSPEGKIKVRVWVSPKIELIFNSTYRFE